MHLLDCIVWIFFKMTNLNDTFYLLNYLIEAIAAERIAIGTL